MGPKVDDRTGPQQWADKLVDNVACATQLDPEKGELANVEDWRRNAAELFKEPGAMIRALLESQTNLGNRVRELEKYLRTYGEHYGSCHEGATMMRALADGALSRKGSNNVSTGSTRT